jgi:hypothetical protein
VEDTTFRNESGKSKGAANHFASNGSRFKPVVPPAVLKSMLDDARVIGQVRSIRGWWV